MGSCTSCYLGSTATNATTVKLILLDGQLREYSSPVKVFLVAPPFDDLGNDHLCSFICNADEMEFDEYLPAMSEEEELRPGHLYFELPSSWLNRRLAAEDMASLAVKAGTALMISGSKVRCGCCIKRFDPSVFCEGDDDVGGNQSHGVGGGGGRRRGNGRMFTKVERIAEE